MVRLARYLVTGGAGFIGSHIAAALVAQGEPVRVLDNLSSGRSSNLAAVGDGVELVEADLRDLDAVRALHPRGGNGDMAGWDGHGAL